MNANDIQTEIRPVSDFNRVSIIGNLCSAQLFIIQAEQDGLTIEAPPEYLARLRSEVSDGKLILRLRGSWLQELEDALSTSLSRPEIVFHLSVRQLNSLHIQCIQSVHVSRLETKELKVRLNGVGGFILDGLIAESLEFHHSGTGMVQVTGKAERQSVVLNGVGSYQASGLTSQHANVRISGVGTARILVSQSLEAWVRGVGILEYSGEPHLQTHIYGPGQVVKIASARQPSD